MTGQHRLTCGCQTCSGILLRRPLPSAQPRREGLQGLVLRARGQLLRSERGQGIPQEGTGARLTHGGSGHVGFGRAVEASGRHPDAGKREGNEPFLGKGGVTEK